MKFITDEETLEEMELVDAAVALADAEANWHKLHHASRKTTVAEWDALESRCQADERLWRLFTRGDRSLNSAYNSYRERLLKEHDPEA